MTRVTVFGATGPVGCALVDLLSSQHPEWTIQAVSRSNSSRLTALKDLRTNVEIIQDNADATKLDQVLHVTESSDMIFCCIGFPRYETKYWAATWPVIMDNLLKATGGNKKFIFCDNLYAYGTGTISPHKADPIQPGTGSKMAVRALLHQRIRQHMKEHPGTVTVVGAADFFGPHVTVSLLGDVFVGKIVQDQAPVAFGNKIHDFCYVPDFAAALALAASDPKAYDKFWIAPHSVHGKTMQEIADDVSRAAGKQPPRKLSLLRPWVVYLLSPFWGLMYEMKGMLGIWTQDYIVDDSDFVRAFGLTATPYDEAIQQTVRYFQEQTKKDTSGKG